VDNHKSLIRLDSCASLPTFGIMRKSSVRTPKETIKGRRLPKVGEAITITATVVRTGRNTHDTADTVTLRIPGFDTPVTVNPAYLEAED
jgi:hypothetical protein